MNRGVKEIDHILQIYNMKSQDFTLCRGQEFEDIINQFIFTLTKTLLFYCPLYQKSEFESQFKVNNQK